MNALMTQSWSEQVAGKFAPIGPEVRLVTERFLVCLDLKKIAELLKTQGGEDALAKRMAALRELIEKYCSPSTRQTISPSTDSIDILYPATDGKRLIKDVVRIQRASQSSASGTIDGCCISVTFGELVLSGKETSGPVPILAWSLAAMGNPGSIFLSDLAKAELSKADKINTKRMRITPREYEGSKTVYELLWSKLAYGLRPVYRSAIHNSRRAAK